MKNVDIFFTEASRADYEALSDGLKNECGILLQTRNTYMKWLTRESIISPRTT